MFNKRKKTPDNQAELERRVLVELDNAYQLKRSQLTVGPLRHGISNENRDVILNSLVSRGLIETFVGDQQFGKSANWYRITDKGRRFVEKASQAA